MEKITKLSSKQLEILKYCRIPRMYGSTHKSILKLVRIGFIAENGNGVDCEHRTRYQITDAGKAWLTKDQKKF